MSLHVDPEILRWCVRDPERFARVQAGLRDSLIRNRCVYNDQPVPMTPVPLVLEPALIAQLREAATAFSGILDRVIDLACHEPEVAAWFRWDPPIGDWIRADSPGAIGTGISRFDALLTDDGRVQFLEFNTDNPGGKSWNHLFSVCWMEQPELAPFLEGRVEPLVDLALEELYRFVVQQGHRFYGVADLRVAFVDILDESGINDEHHLAADYLSARGLDGFVHDARQLELRDGRLFAGDRQVHVVYRGMQVHEFLEFEGLEPLVRAYREGAVLLLNSFRAALGSQKAALAFISDPGNAHWFDPAQREAIARYLPWTTRLSQVETMDWDGRKVGLEWLLRVRQADLVLKPSSGSGGRGVMIGRAVEPGDWEATWRAHLGDPHWVVQRYVTLPTVEVPILRDGRVDIERKYININPYVIGGRYAGTLARYSDQPVINVEAGGGVMPVFHGLAPDGR